MRHTAVPCKDTLPRKLSSVMIKFSYCEYLSQYCNAEVIVVMFCRDCAEAGVEETGRAKENHSLFVAGFDVGCIMRMCASVESTIEEFKYCI